MTFYPKSMMKSRYFVVIPAAGVGQRLGDKTPKQYLKILNKTILQWCIDIFLNQSIFEQVVVVLRDSDPYWSQLHGHHPKLMTCLGGKERCHSVFNGLTALSHIAKNQDWVLVHDAVRPCLHPDDLMNLVEQITPHPIGGILATPAKDTIKQLRAEKLSTPNRNTLLHAQTPQMFRYGLLMRALAYVIERNQSVPDESSAVELIAQPIHVMDSRPGNIKITEPIDLFIAEKILSDRSKTLMKTPALKISRLA
jgi:2-C-methyl-D-erythritol 4-phosphate cytidylyltransferase